MQLSRFALLSAGALAFAGCDSDEGPTLAPNVPIAAVRYINAMPDTGGTTWRFVDQIENSPVFVGLPFRGFSPYQAAEAGSRHLKVFTTTNDILYTSQTFTDTTLNLASGSYYTFLQVGMARGGATPEQFVVLEDVFPTVGPTDIAVRFVNAGVGLGPIDVYSAISLLAPPTPATPIVANLAYLGVSPYVMVPAAPSTGFVQLAAVESGFTRTTGSFIEDGFTVGRQIVGGRFSNAPNNTRSYITAVTATTITIGPTTGPIAVTAGADSSLTRATGSFLDEGFTSGMRVKVTGFALAGNAVTGTITSVTATRIKLNTGLTVEAGAAVTITKVNVAEAEAPGRLILGEHVFRANAAGTATELAELTAPSGAPEEPLEQLQVVGGTAMPGTVLSAFFMPRSVSGSDAANFTTPNWVYVIDKNPR